MHNTLKLFILFVCFILITGCDNDEKIKYRIETIHQETDEYNINGEKIILEGESEGISVFNNDVDEEIKLWREDFLSRISNNPGEDKPQLQFKQIVQNNENGILSIVTEKYTYISGLHGNTWRTARTYDKEKDSIIRLGDLFLEKNYHKILNEKISDIIENKPDTYHDLWEMPVVDEKCENNFYLDSGNVIIFYEPYELSYYARGVVEFSIPIEEIRGYIKEEYLCRIGKLRNVTSHPA